MASDFALRGRLGGLTTALRHDPRETTKAGRAAFLGRFYAETDPSLTETERQRQADVARRLYFAEMARKSAMRREVKGRNARKKRGGNP